MHKARNLLTTVQVTSTNLHRTTCKLAHWSIEKPCAILLILLKVLEFNEPPCVAWSHQDPGTSSTHHILSSFAEEFQPHNDRLLRKVFLSQSFAVAWFWPLSDGSSSSLVVFCFVIVCLFCINWYLLTDHCSQFIQLNSWAESLVPLYVVMPHANFPKITQMVCVGLTLW